MTASTDLAVAQPRTLRGFLVSASGEVRGPSGKKLNPFPVRGYLRVTRFSEGKYVAEPVHRLVCEAFHGRPPTGRPHVAHLDGDPLNNEASNLRWVSQEENESHKDAHGTKMRGSRHHQAKLTESEVLAIRQDERNNTEIAKDYGVSRMAISCVKRRVSWTHL